MIHRNKKINFEKIVRKVKVTFEYTGKLLMLKPLLLRSPSLKISGEGLLSLSEDLSKPSEAYSKPSDNQLKPSEAGLKTSEAVKCKSEAFSCESEARLRESEVRLRAGKAWKWGKVGFGRVWLPQSRETFRS